VRSEEYEGSRRRRAWDMEEDEEPKWSTFLPTAVGVQHGYLYLSETPMVAAAPLQANSCSGYMWNCVLVLVAKTVWTMCGLQLPYTPLWLFCVPRLPAQRGTAAALIARYDYRCNLHDEEVFSKIETPQSSVVKQFKLKYSCGCHCR
jgi:hypothetical protein